MVLGKKDILLGVDIGSHAVKIVQVQAKDATLRLVSLGLAPVPREAFTEGRIGKPDMVAGSVRELASQLKLKAKLAAGAISGYEVMIKKIELPTMTEEELEARMSSELGQYIPYNIEEVDVDYQVLGISKERANLMDVLLVAAKKESVNDYVELIRLSGFEPAVVDVDFFCLSNALEATYGLADNTVAMVDIGANKAIMNIVSKGVPVFTRGISIGGSQVTDGIKDSCGVSYEEAEKIKLGEVRDNVQKRDVEAVFVSIIRNWVNECKRAVDFYYSNYPDRRIEKFFLSGGSSRIPGLDKVFQEHLGVETAIFNPLSKIQYDPKVFDPAYLEYIGPQMAISLGLALRRTVGK
jgi:type IV pilus assembly protein PilM